MGFRVCYNFDHAPVSVPPLECHDIMMAQTSGFHFKLRLRKLSPLDAHGGDLKSSVLLLLF